MVIKEILKVWNKGGLIKQANDDAMKMIALTKDMYVCAIDGLKSDSHKCELDIREIDRGVNDLQRDVRRKVLEHLSISPQQDITASLILILAANDLERIGDYCKNMHDLIEVHPHALEKNEYYDMVDEIDHMLRQNFDLLGDAFKNADKEKAQKIVDNYVVIKANARDMVKRLLEDKELGRRRLIIYSLLSRHLRRLAAHQKNTATTVIKPFERIGYSKDGA